MSFDRFLLKFFDLLGANKEIKTILKYKMHSNNTVLKILITISLNPTLS